jgi:hypothetical protein
LKKNNPDNSGNWKKIFVDNGLHRKRAESSKGSEDRTISKQSQFTGMKIPLSYWTRSLCTSNEYPAFGDPEPIVVPDTLTEEMSEFSGFACYETTFVLDNPKALLLEISDTIGSVEVFMNGDTAGMQVKPPYHYDLSSLAWQGKNHLAIEVAINMGRKYKVTKEKIKGKAKYSKRIKNPDIIGSVKLYAS